MGRILNLGQFVLKLVYFVHTQKLSCICKFDKDGGLATFWKISAILTEKYLVIQPVHLGIPEMHKQMSQQIIPNFLHNWFLWRKRMKC
jgi:hypothetical protein